MSEKLMLLMELLEELEGIYPELDKVIVNDPESPDYIILATSEYLEDVSEMFGISNEFSEIEFEKGEVYPDIPKKNKKGTLH